MPSPPAPAAFAAASAEVEKRLSADPDSLRRCEDMVRGILKPVGLANDVQDVLNEAKIRAAEKFVDFDPRRAFFPWFWTIARNRALDVYRAEKARRRAMRRYAKDPTVALTSPSARLPAPELELSGSNLAEAIEGLPVDHRDVLQLYLELRLAKDPPGNVHAEICCRLGIGVSTSKQRVRRSLTRIRYCVARYPVTPPCARFIVTMRFALSEKSPEEPVSDVIAEQIAAELSGRLARKPGLLDCLRKALDFRDNLRKGAIGVRQVLRKIEARFDRYEAGG